jgi:hypothetical protein
MLFVAVSAIGIGLVVWFLTRSDNNLSSKPVTYDPAWLTVPEGWSVEVRKWPPEVEFEGTYFYIRFRCSGEPRQACEVLSRSLAKAGYPKEVELQPVSDKNIEARNMNPDWLKKVQLPASKIRHGFMIVNRSEGGGVTIQKIYGVGDGKECIIELIASSNL